MRLLLSYTVVAALAVYGTLRGAEEAFRYAVVRRARRII